MKEWLLMTFLVHIVERLATKNYTFQPQNMVVDLNSKKKDYHYCPANIFPSSLDTYNLMPKNGL